MKKLLNNILLLAILMVASVAMVSCAKDELPVEGTFTMTVEASKAGNGEAKELSLSGSILNATWKAGESVTVYNITRNAALTGTLTAQNISNNGRSCRLSGELNGAIAEGDSLLLKFLSPNYGSQNGTLAYIAAHCDYAEARVKVASIGSGNTKNITTTAAASFVNKQAIVKFSLKDKGNSDAAINASFLTISNGANTYTVTPASATSEYYVALPGFASSTVTLAAAEGSNLYLYEKSGIGFTNGQYKEITVKMTKNNVWNYSYTGAVQTFTAPCAGTFTLEVWGAQGGNRPHNNEGTGTGGKGGYATCRTTLAAGETVYVYVGGQGVTVPDDNNWNNGVGGAGGWNGGGAGGNGAGNHSGSAGGGGATHISKVNNQVIGSGQCASLVGTNFIIVAGGGGGGGHPKSYAGNGGGDNGEMGKKAGTNNNPETYSDYFYYNTSRSYGAAGGNGCDGQSTSAEGAGGGGGGYYGGAAYMSGSTFTTTYQDAGGCGGNSACNSNFGSNFSTTAGQQDGNGKAVITWYGTSYPSK